MHFEKLPKGPAPLVRVRLNIEESFLAASSAFVGMSPGVDVQTRVRSGQIGDVALGRSQDNAFFLNQYRASVQEAEVLLAARVVGDVHHEELVVKPLLVRPDAFMAVGTTVSLSTLWRGSRSMSANDGIRMIRCSGRGDLLMNAFGQFHFISIPSEQSYVIDARYLVGLDDQMSIRIRRVGGVRTVGLANEERAIEVQGPGRLIMQTRAREFPRNKA